MVVESVELQIVGSEGVSEATEYVSESEAVVQRYLLHICLQRNHTSHKCSPVNLLHIFRSPFLKNTSGRLLLYIWKF